MTKDQLNRLRLPELQQRYREVIGEETRCPNRGYLVRRIKEAMAGRRRAAPVESAAAQNENEPSPAPMPVESEAPLTTAVQASAIDAAKPLEPRLVAPEAQAPVVEVPNERGVTVAEASDAAEAGEAGESAAASTPPQRLRGRYANMTIEELRAQYVRVIGRQTHSSNKAYLQWKLREADKGRIPIGPPRNRISAPSSSQVKVLPLRMDVSDVESLDAARRRSGLRSRTELFRKALHYYLARIGEDEVAERFRDRTAAL